MSSPVRALLKGVPLLIAVVIIASGGPAGTQGRSDQAPAIGNADAQFIPNEVLVQFRGRATDDERANGRAAVGGRYVETVVIEEMREDGLGDLELVALPPGMSVAAAVARLRSHFAVEFAEPNWVYYHQATSNDPYYTNGSLWGMYGDATSPANQYGSQAGEAWAADKTGLGTVYVGIIDEGFMYDHADLSANAWTNEHDPVDGVDNDGNGYVDDVHGWDFDGNDNTAYDGTQDDHGTHVAGTIGAAGGNGIGVAGVSWQVKMISAKFLGRRGGTTANAIKAVKYITDLRVRHGLKIVATNNSWGGGGYSQGLLDAIKAAWDADILFIASAGNNGVDLDVTPVYPASYGSTVGTNNCEGVIAVAAIAKNGSLASWSNRGTKTVDVGAPGVDIISTVPGKRGASSYASYSGTSMAAPHVTGAAALYASTHPGASAAQIKAAILNSAAPTPSLSIKCVTGGRLNVSGF
jgi:subtilisin family serine protease